MSDKPCGKADGCDRLIIVALKDNKVTFTDEAGNDATEKTVRPCDYLRWYTTYGRLDFDFPDGHPFYPNPKPITSPGYGNTVRVHYSTPITTKYSVTLTESGGTSHEVDPKVIIDNGPLTSANYGGSEKLSGSSRGIMRFVLVTAAVAAGFIVVTMMTDRQRD